MPKYGKAGGAAGFKRQRNVNRKSGVSDDTLFEKRGGGSIQTGLANRETGHTNPSELGLDTQGPNQVPQKHPSSKAARGTRWGP